MCQHIFWFFVAENSDKVVVMDRNRSFTAPASSRCTAIFQRSKSTLYESPKKSEKVGLPTQKMSKKANNVVINVTGIFYSVNFCRVISLCTDLNSQHFKKLQQGN